MLSEKRIKGKCRPVVTGHSGFCFDFRLTATFNTYELESDPIVVLLFEILMHVNLFNTMDDVIRNLVHEQITRPTVTENGVLEVDMSGVVLVMNLVAMDEAYNGAVEKLKEYSTYAKWVNDAYTVKLTPTPFKPIPKNVKAFAQFHDTEEIERCFCYV